MTTPFPFPSPSPVLVIFGSFAREGSTPADLDIAYWGMSHREATDLAEQWLIDTRGSAIGVPIDAHPELASVEGGVVTVSIPHPFGTETPPTITVCGEPRILGMEVRTIAALIRRLADDNDADRFAADFQGGYLSVFADPAPGTIGGYVGNGIASMRRALDRCSGAQLAAVDDRIPGLPALLGVFAEGVSPDAIPALVRGTPRQMAPDAVVSIYRLVVGGEWRAGPVHADFSMSLAVGAAWLAGGSL